MRSNKIINKAENPNPEKYEDMIKELEYMINKKDDSFVLPNLDELFSFEYSGIIIEGSYKGRHYDGTNGKKLLSILKEKTKLISHNCKQALRGSENSDYSFHTDNSTYIFEHNGLYLTVEIFTPRSLSSTQYELTCNDTI